jgi:hypothetical protein
MKIFVLSILVISFVHSLDYRFEKIEKCESSNSKMVRLDECSGDKKQFHIIAEILEKIEKAIVSLYTNFIKKINKILYIHKRSKLKSSL